MKRLLLMLTFVAGLAPAWAQTPAMRPSGTIQNIEVDPIRCWWRTSAGAVRIGEQFELLLTCAVLETEAVQVVPDESHLGAAVIALAPFEVVSGTPIVNLRSGARRFFQYQYVLRLINPDAIGRDVPLPTIVIQYKVNSRVAANTSVEGRDLAYVLPTLSVRIESLVPADAPDIRDAAGGNFSAVDSLGLRAGVLEIVAMTAVALGVLMSLFVVVRMARSAKARTPADQRQWTTRAVLGAAVKELAAVQRDRERSGWSEALAGRALAATRIAAACVIGRPVSQRIADAGAPDDGRVLASRLWRGKPRAFSSPVTSADLTRHASSSTVADGAQQSVEELRAALDGFTASQYGRGPALDESGLDSALSSATSAARRVKAEHSRLKDLFRQVVGGRTVAASHA